MTHDWTKLARRLGRVIQKLSLRSLVPDEIVVKRKRASGLCCTPSDLDQIPLCDTSAGLMNCTIKLQNLREETHTSDLTWNCILSQAEKRRWRIDRRESVAIHRGSNVAAPIDHESVRAVSPPLPLPAALSSSPPDRSREAVRAQARGSCFIWAIQYRRQWTCDWNSIRHLVRLQPLLVMTATRAEPLRHGANICVEVMWTSRSTGGSENRDVQSIYTNSPYRRNGYRL